MLSFKMRTKLWNSIVAMDDDDGNDDGDDNQDDDDIDKNKMI